MQDEQDQPNEQEQLGPSSTDISGASLNTINSLFSFLYFKVILIVLIILLVIVIIFIFVIPILLVYDNSETTLYKTSNENKILVSYLMKYKTVMYNWCNFDTFTEGFSKFIEYKFYTPVFFIYIASIILYMTLIIAALHTILMITISLILGVSLKQVFNEDKSFATNATILLGISVIIIALWGSIYGSFDLLILRHTKEAFKYNILINDIIDKIVNNDNIFPDKILKEELFDDIINKNDEPTIIMEEYYTNLGGLQFKDPTERARYLVLFVILKYIQHINGILRSSEYRDTIKHYLLYPYDNKDLFIGFTLENTTLKDYIVTNIEPFDSLVNNIFKVPIPTKEKIEIRREYNRILNEEILDNLKKTNDNIDRTQPYIYSIIVVIIAMIIIFGILYIVKNPTIILGTIKSFGSMVSKVKSSYSTTQEP